MLIGGGVVTVAEQLWGREPGLRTPFAVAVVLELGLFWYVCRRLPSVAIRAALDDADPATAK
jgi:hypothetical protein